MSLVRAPISPHRRPGTLSAVEGGPSAPLRVAVVGAGRWGRLHAAKLLAAPGVELVALVERDGERARAMAAETGVAVARLRELPARGVEAAVVAVDLRQLAPVTAELLEMGLHVLTEKPLAARAADAARLVELAARQRRLLAVGYVERFVAPADPGSRLVCRRVGPERAATPLGLDWMVHDLDHALRCLGRGLRPVEASWGVDRASVRLAADGREARITAVRRERPPWRRLWLDGQRVDLTAALDPLAAEVRAFCRAVRGGPPGPLASGAEALAVLTMLEAAGG